MANCKCGGLGQPRPTLRFMQRESHRQLFQSAYHDLEQTNRIHHMNTVIRNLSFGIIAVQFIALLSGCAGLHQNTEHLLSSAGFKTRMPSTPQERDAYDRMESYKLKRGDISGKVVYTYKDPKQGVVYLGNEK